MRILVPLLVTGLLAGCGGMLPTAQQEVGKRWRDFDDVKKTFDQIVPYSTDMETVRRLGFDPYTTPNRVMQK